MPIQKLTKKNNLKELNRIKKIASIVLKKHGIKKASLFGSYVRGEQKEDSDIDIIIEPTKNMSLLDFVGIKLDLQKELRMKVDLTDYKTIRPEIKGNVLKEEVRVI